jgi:adenine phosphoribosyltransferase
MEARGFIFGAAVAARLGVPFVPVRKPGKLPVPVISIDYALEYGTDRLEIDPEAISQGQRVVILDDLIATGGTALAATQLLRRAGLRSRMRCLPSICPIWVARRSCAPRGLLSMR